MGKGGSNVFEFLKKEIQKAIEENTEAVAKATFDHTIHKVIQDVVPFLTDCINRLEEGHTEEVLENLRTWRTKLTRNDPKRWY